MTDARAKALVVEDDAATRTLLAELLESIDCDVDLAADGEEALPQLRSRHYDVILLDIVLPKMSGIDVMESLRRDHPHILGCIIVVTGLDIREIRTLFPVRTRDALQAGDPEPAATGSPLLPAPLTKRLTNESRVLAPPFHASRFARRTFHNAPTPRSCRVPKLPRLGHTGRGLLRKRVV